MPSVGPEQQRSALGVETAPFTAEFAHLRAAIEPELPDWNEIRFVWQLLEPYANTPERQEVLVDLMAASDRAALHLAVNRLQAASGIGPAAVARQ